MMDDVEIVITITEGAAQTLSNEGVVYTKNQMDQIVKLEVESDD